MKIAFFTEGGWSGPVERNNPNMRTDLAWICALGAIHFPLDFNAVQLHQRDRSELYDLGIIIIPKKYPTLAWRKFLKAHPSCKRWAVMQEGPHWYYTDYDVETQFEYLQFLGEQDIIFCHNQIDKKYYQGIFPEKRVEILASLLIESSIDRNLLTPQDQRSGTMIGGNFVSWYSGMDSFIIAQYLNERVLAPSMGRRQKQEHTIDGIQHLPYMNWREWMGELSKCRYGVHLMRTHAAGTFALNCAYLGIPCIGYKGLDTQEICFPELSVDIGDLSAARKAAQHLASNEPFYNHVSAYARKAWYDHFREEIFIENFRSILFN